MYSTKYIISFFARMVLVLFFFGSCTQRTTEGSIRNQTAVSPKDIILQKNFPFIHTILSNNRLQQWMNNNETLKMLAKSKQQSLQERLNIEDQVKFHEIGSIANSFHISEIEMQSALDEWMKLSETTWLENVIDSLRSTNQFFLINKMDNKDFIQNVWKQELNGINQIISVYATGESPRYAQIDSVSYNVQSEYYKKLINITALNVIDDIKDTVLFFEPSLDFALWLLVTNNRDEAARFEPMESGENSAALHQISHTNWDQYPYSVILVPGHGPEEEGIALSPLGMIRCKLAADRYYKGKAPFIILSGGYVHPFQTPFCEAIEMKKELMTTYTIPESALIIEPHARHTTTNFRNAARLIYKYNIPAEKKALCTTTLDQSFYITNMNFDQRCMQELGYLPYKLGDRLNRNDVEFYPLIESYTLNCNDPLDP